MLLKIREKRQEMGFSQVSLAGLSGVSLPTLQRIESGHANPSLQTLEALYEALDIDLKFEDRIVSWDELAALGLPLQSENFVAVKKDSKTLLRALARVLLIESDGREKEALIGLVLAVKLHYPKLYQKLRQQRPEVEAFVPKVFNGRHIKLKRLALAQIGTYL